jgi:hypothetical protein
MMAPADVPAAVELVAVLLQDGMAQPDRSFASTAEHQISRVAGPPRIRGLRLAVELETPRIGDTPPSGVVSE